MIYGNADTAISIKASNTGSNALNIPPNIFSIAMKSGSSFFIATSLLVNAATKPPIAATNIPIMDIFSAPLKLENALSAPLNPLPSIPNGPSAFSNIPAKSSPVTEASLMASSISLMAADILLNSAEPAAVSFNCFFNNFKLAIVGSKLEFTSKSTSIFSAMNHSFS